MFLNTLNTQEDVTGSKRRAEPDENTESMEAGYNALFQSEGEDGMNKFFQVKEELSNQGVSPTSRQLKYDLHDQETKQIEQGAEAMMKDFTMDPEVKANFIGAVGDISQRPESSLPTKLVRDLTIADDDDIVSDEYEENRLRFTGVIDNVTSYREAQQAVLNQKDFRGNQSGITMAVDLAQMMIPFVEQANVSEALIKVGEGSSTLDSFFLMGNAKKEFFNAFKKMPLDQRLMATEQFVKVANEANKTGFITNQLLEQQMVEELLYGGAYGEGDKWVDNLVSLFDLSLFGKPVAWALKAGQKSARAGKSVTGTDIVLSSKDMVRTEVSPVSPIRMASEANAQKTKAMFHGAMTDETEEAAKAFSGTTKKEMAADAIHPEMANEKGAVRSKIHKVYEEKDKTFIDNIEVQHDLAYSNVGAATIKEMESAAAGVVLRMKEAIGVTSRGEMFTHAVTPTGARISGVYGPENGGWNTVADAVSLTEYALREHGITANQMHLLERSTETGEYVRVESTTDNSDYLIGVDYDYRLNFSDVMQWDNLSVKRNFLDAIPLAANFSVNRNFFDPASILDPHLVLGANAVVDKAAKVADDFLVMGKKFADGFGKASKESQAQMHKYILDANDNAIPHNVNTLYGEYGFDAKEIETLTAFREYWDTVWQARNLTEVRAMRNRGFMTYENVKNQDRLFVKPIEKFQTNANEKFYDPLKDEAISLTRSDIEKIYERGGTVGRLRRHGELGEATTNQIIIEKSGDLRMMGDFDKPFPFREGYFQRVYTHPHFIIKRGKTEAGQEFEQAIATADSKVDADIYINRLRSTDKEGDYYTRGDLKDPRQQAEYEMDTFESSGLSSMRSRGEKLEDATSTIRGVEDNNVLGPVDTIIRSSRAMGRNVAEREFIEASKQRFMSQFEEVLPKKFGKPVYPKHMNDIGDAGNATLSSVADARSTYEYISYLEFGYINGMDSIYKGTLKRLASMAAEKKFRAGELALEQAAKLNPVALAKNTAFQMYLATNPLRQFALNAHQSTLLTAIFPKYVLSQKLAKDMTAFYFKAMGFKVPDMVVKATGRTRAEIDLMYTQFERSGLTAGIDQQNMVRGALTDFAESSKYKGELGPISGGLQLSRKIGFDAGELVNLTSSWLAHYERTKSAGTKMDANAFNRISGEARNFTFNMNRAGDMVYNANSMSLFFQYFQVPHKAMLVATNRAMPRSQRAKLIAYNSIMFTLPPAAMVTMFGAVLPDQEKYPEVYDAVLSGLQFHLFNKLIEGVSGETARIDFGNLAPSDAYGVFEMLHAIWTTELGAMIASSPSGQLLFGSNPRITNLVRTASNFFFPDQETREDPVKFSHLQHDILSLSSGYSNIYKARQALSYGKIYGSRGQVTDASVSTPEAIALAWGFRTMDATLTTAVSMDMWRQSDAFTKDVNKWYKDFTRKLNVQDITAEEQDYVIKTMAEAYSVFDGSEKAQRIITKNLERDAKSGTAVMFDAVLRSADYISPDQLKAWADALPDSEFGGKAELKETIKFIEDFEYKE